MKKTKLNKNILIWFAVFFLLFQLGKIGYRNDWFTLKKTSNEILKDQEKLEKLQERIKKKF